MHKDSIVMGKNHKQTGKGNKKGKATRVALPSGSCAVLLVLI
jgi:hypothetical protein